MAFSNRGISILSNKLINAETKLVEIRMFYHANILLVDSMTNSLIKNFDLL